MKRILLVSIALCLGLSSMAEAGGIGVAVRGSTLGGGLEVGLGLAPDLSLRGGLNGATYSYSGTESGNDYEFDLTLSSVTGLVDYHLLGGGFRITGGLVLNGNKLEAVAETGFNVEYDVGGEIYTVEEVGTLNGDIEFSSTAPYRLGEYSRRGQKARLVAGHRRGAAGQSQRVAEHHQGAARTGAAGRIGGESAARGRGSGGGSEGVRFLSGGVDRDQL